jgi:hypothetical protein
MLGQSLATRQRPRAAVPKPRQAGTGDERQGSWRHEAIAGSLSTCASPSLMADFSRPEAHEQAPTEEIIAAPTMSEQLRRRMTQRMHCRTMPGRGIDPRNVRRAAQGAREVRLRQAGAVLR